MWKKVKADERLHDPLNLKLQGSVGEGLSGQDRKSQDSEGLRPESHHQLLPQSSCSPPVHLLPTSRVLGGDQQEMLKVGTTLY